MKQYRPQFALCGCVLVLYLAFLTKTYYWDGVLFSLDIESVHRQRMPFAGLFHPNHLLYNALGYWIYAAIAFLWPGIRAITVLQALNVVLSAGAACLIFTLARRLTGARGVPLFCGLLFAAGATWWKFSIDADSYIVSVLLLLLSALFLLKPNRRIVAAGLFHAAAMLFHELAIFSYVPVLAYVFVERSNAWRKRLAIAFAYCAGTGCIVAMAYGLAYQAADHSTYPNLFSWVTSYSKDKGFTSSASDIVGHYLTSYIKLFAGGKLSLIRQFFSLLVCAALALCVALLIRGIWLLKRPGGFSESKVDRHGLVFLWTWFIAYALFLGLWDPGSAFHKLFLWPAIVLVTGIYTRKRVAAAIALAGALAAWNFGAFIYPHSQVAADPVLVLARKIDRELPKDAVVYYRTLSPDDWYIEYFAPGREWKPLPLNTDNRSGPVCLETTALSDFHGALDARQQWQLVNSQHHIR